MRSSYMQKFSEIWTFMNKLIKIKMYLSKISCEMYEEQMKMLRILKNTLKKIQFFALNFKSLTEAQRKI